MPVFPEQKPVRFGQYLLLDRINVGGMAEVFRGKTSGVEGFARLVALKRILPSIAEDPDFVEMFIDEAKLAVQLQHANIAQIYDLGKADDMYYIAMEYVSGVDLRTMWDRARQRNRLLPIAMSCYIMQRVCEGLDAAHRKKEESGRDLGLVHRDVSPQNVLISFEGEVKVIDFGIAKSKAKVGKTQAGILKGKFGYMSPEQVRGLELDNRSDIFATGAVLYELVVGDRLFLGESDFSTLEKVRNVEMVPPTRLNKNLSPHLERIVMKALAKNREDRYRWASEMAEDLQRYLFASNQPFARTDLQRYMQQHFKEEMEKEKDRLERYKGIKTEDFDERPQLSPPRERSVATDLMATADFGGASLRPEVELSALKPAPMVLSKLAGNGVPARPLPPERPVAPELPPPPPPARSRMPAWAAGLIGGLLAVSLLAVGVLVYVLTSKPVPGAITVDVAPAAAEIFVNDKLVSNASPYTLDNLTPGSYVLTVKKEGYQTLIRAVTVAAGEARMESVQLERNRGSASVVVRSRPEGLALWIDGKDTGKQSPANLGDLQAGDHQLLLKRGEVVVHRVRLSLTDSAAEVVDVDLAKLPTILDVISEPAGAQVSVNGEARGTAPATIPNLKPGAVKVEVLKEGCRRFEQNLLLERPEIRQLHVRLECGG